MQRRDFLQTGLMTAAGCLAGNAAQVSVLAAGAAAAAPPAVAVDKRICLFTDHLDDFGYSYAEVAEMLTPLKIAGPDLTVRGGGLVPPDRAADELPKAAAAFSDKGMSIRRMHRSREPSTPGS